MNKHPRLTPWREPADLVSLRSFFFPQNTPTFDISMLESYNSAIQKVQLFKSRSNRIPHCLDMTSVFMMILIQYYSSAEGDGSQGGFRVQNFQYSATLALIRFVNGLLDPNQQSSFAIPLQVLAKKIGLSSFFVELRHLGTHEDVISEEMCLEGVERALEWIYVNYWERISVGDKDGLMDLDDDDEGEEEKKLMDKMAQSLKEYRRIRRQNVNKFIKFGDSTEVGKLYWKTVKEMVELLEEGATNTPLDLLIDKMLSAKLKFEALKLLYEPFFNVLFTKYEDVALAVIDRLLNIRLFELRYRGGEGEGEESSAKEEIYIKKWLHWLVLEKSKSFGKLVDIIGKNMNNEYNHELMTRLKELVKERELMEKIDKRLESTKNVVKRGQEKAVVKDVDDILGDLESLKKRFKANRTKKVVLFVQAEEWTPKPFGVI